MEYNWAVDSDEIPCVVCNFAVILYYLTMNNLAKEDRFSFTDRSVKKGVDTVIQ